MPWKVLEQGEGFATPPDRGVQGIDNPIKERTSMQLVKFYSIK